MKKTALTLILMLSFMLSYAQDCDCLSHFEWVKQTFEKNDAGFAYALELKGRYAYDDHNKRILDKVKSAETKSQCTSILYEWLRFFRSGHVGIRPLNSADQSNASAIEPDSFTDWETFPLNKEEFKQYLDEGSDDYEGIWETGGYIIGIKKQGTEYIGSILESKAETWTEGQVKLRFTLKEDQASSTFFMRDHSAVESENVFLVGNNYLHIGNVDLRRIYPEVAEDPDIEAYYTMLETDSPYLDQLNEKTLYLRIPSFQPLQKRAIDSVIFENRSKILETENLIIDIRNGTGGSDASYHELLPFMYTNPVRFLGLEYYSTKLNNQRMLDFLSDPKYGFNEAQKKWAKESYDILEGKLGEFVNLEEDIVTIREQDTVYAYPKHIGIIINQGNGSTDEQFILAAKQSKKVKLFGTTTFGVLDISNMYFVTSPCNEFELGYCLSRSFRIPEFTIDGKGLQPDFYLDKSIPLHEWTQTVNRILNEW